MHKRRRICLLVQLIMSDKSNLKVKDSVAAVTPASDEMKKVEQKKSNSRVKQLVSTIEADTKSFVTTIANDSTATEKTYNVEVTDEKAPDNTCTGDDGPYMSSQGSCL
jgi:uncharacterized protein YpmS